jgi:hypothetical protein
MAAMIEPFAPAVPDARYRASRSDRRRVDPL